MSNVTQIKERLSNESGILPMEYKVLVRVQAENKNAAGETVTKSGIIIPRDTTEREEMAKIEGVLIDVGGNAFDDWKGRTPQPGDNVLIEKYSGLMVTGQDGEEYRLINDKDIAAIVRVSHE